MARPRKSRATTDEGRYLASRMIDARRRGATNADIGRAYNMNERTVRRIIAGETSGTRTFKRLVEPSITAAPNAPNRSIIRVDIRLPNGDIRSVNARVPTVLTRSGQRVAATPADIFRVPQLNTLLIAEMKRLEERYGIISGGQSHIASFRPITHRRAPLRIAISNI
jgi:hypothetical protein